MAWIFQGSEDFSRSGSMNQRQGGGRKDGGKKMLASFFRARTTAFLAGTALVFAANGTLFATETLTLSDTSGDTITCTGGSCVTGGAHATVTSYSDNGTGSIVFNGSIGGWTVETDTGVSYPDQGSTTVPDLTLTSHSSGTASTFGNLTINFTDTLFTTTPVSLIADAGGTNQKGSGTGAGFTSAAFKFSANNSQFAAYNPGSTASYNFPGSVQVISPTSPYTLSIEAVIGGGKGSAGFTADIASAVPEPGLYGTLAAGVGGLFFVLLRRRKLAGA